MQHLSGDFTLYCCSYYIFRFFFKILLSLFTLPVYYIFLLYPSLSLSPPFSTLSSFLPLFSSLAPSLLLLSSFSSLIYPISTSFSLFFFSTSPTYFSYLSIYILSYPSFLVSSLINTAPIRGFYTLLLLFLYLQIFSQNTSFALYSSRLLYFLSLSFSTSLSSFFHSFLISPSFLFSLSFATSTFLFPFSYLFHIYFFLPFLFFLFSTYFSYLSILPLYIPCHILPSYFPR